MKIGTLTLHRSINYGSQLQAYALQRILNSFGHNSEVIDYWYPGSDQALFGRNYSNANSIKTKMLLALDYLISKIGSIGKEKELRIKRTVEFQNKFTPLSKTSYKNFTSLYNSVLEYDAYVCGSDQIWNPSFLSTDKAFRLEFAPPSKKKIAYAASFAVPDLSPEQELLYKEPLSSFDFISVRESNGQDIIENLLHKKVDMVLDPVLLLTREEWLELTVPIEIKEKYIICYFLENNKNNFKLAYDLQKLTGASIYSIGYHPKYLLKPKIKNIIGAGPLEFISLIAGASFVVTDSFHGTVFSTIFQKPFYILADISKGRKKMSSRIYSLMTLLKLKNRIFSDDLIVNENQIDYSDAQRILSAERQKSINILKNAINQ